MRNDCDTILILDFGGQYSQLIARRIRELGVYSILKPFDTLISELENIRLKGIILSGSHKDVFLENAPKPDEKIFELNVPVLGICYGAQWIIEAFGGKVVNKGVREYGTVVTEFYRDQIFSDCPDSSEVLMSHTNEIIELPEDFTCLALTSNNVKCAFKSLKENIYALLFHPEVKESVYGRQILKNFLSLVCNLKCDWNVTNFLLDLNKELLLRIGNKKLICAVSGGVDSTVAAFILDKLVPENLTLIFVDNGLLRKSNYQDVEVLKTIFKSNFLFIDAKEKFFGRLAGILDPESKRKIIGEEFIKIFEEETKKFGDPKEMLLVQGTIYPDLVESGFLGSAKIKSHHNVGGIPENIEFSGVIEPLRNLFKDEVRKLGIELGVPKEFINRQPFPGPGFAVRCVGEVTKEKIEILREADNIWLQEIESYGLDNKPDQYFAVITDCKSVGVMGDDRSYAYVIALRAVQTDDFMTAKWMEIPHQLLDMTAKRIVNEVKGVNRVVYDITSKPPATIEWE